MLKRVYQKTFIKKPVGRTLARPHFLLILSGRSTRRPEMKFALIGAAALVTAASVTPALAQQVIEDRLLRAVLPERKLPKSGTWQSIHRWQLPAKRLAER